MDISYLRYLGIFFLVAAAQGIFFSLAQLSDVKRVKGTRIFLSAIIILFSISLIESGLWWSDKIGDFIHFILVSEPVVFLFGPLIWFYFRSSLTRFIFRPRHTLHLVPFILCFVYCSQFFFNTAASKAAMLRDEIPFREFFPFYISSVLLVSCKALSLLFYCFKIYIDLSHKTVLREVRTWFRLSFGTFCLYTFSFIFFHILSYQKIIGGCADYCIGISVSLFIYLFAWFGLVRPRVFEGYAVAESLKPLLKKKPEPASDARMEGLKTRLMHLMEAEKLYRSEDIRLEALAQRLSVPRHVLSQVINSTGMSFFEFINHWRVEEAKRILSETTKKELNIIEVAYEVGFGNKVSFNRFFKRSTGLTPTEFRKNRLADDRRAKNSPAP